MSSTSSPRAGVPSRRAGAQRSPASGQGPSSGQNSTAGRAAADAGGPPMGYVLADRFYAVSAAMHEMTGKMLQELGLTEALADALWQLDPADGPQPRRSLATRLHCDPSNVTFLVDRLEERGLVERMNDPHDRRIKAIGLTAQGTSVREALVRATELNPVFARLTAQQQQQLADLLGRCVDPPAATEEP